MEFPDGNVIERWEREGVRTIISELEKLNFTGLLKIRALKANVLMIEGEVVAATCGDTGGEAAWDTLSQYNEAEAEAHELSLDKAQFCFVWYNEVYGYERVHKKEMEREEILEKVGLTDPDKKKLEDILKREGMEHLFKKEDKEPKDI